MQLEKITESVSLLFFKNSIGTEFMPCLVFFKFLMINAHSLGVHKSRTKGAWLHGGTALSGLNEDDGIF